MYISPMCGVSGNANANVSTIISIPNYANTTFYKNVYARYTEQDSGTPTQRIGNAGATWLSTAAISTLTLSTTGTNFLNGSIATCYLML